MDSGTVLAVLPLAGANAGIPQNIAAKAAGGGGGGGGGAVGAGEEVNAGAGTTAKAVVAAKSVVRVSNVGSVSSANCIAWHPQRYWLAYAGEPGGLRVVGAAGGEL